MKLDQIYDQIAGQHIAVLGKTGSGKTYTAKGIAEHLLELGRQVCVLDPTGAWWGLRLAADGKDKGYDVVLLGGKHGDIPLAPTSGAAVARMVTQQFARVVCDTSGMTVGEYTRWFIDFASTLYTTIREPLHLIIDEAHYFMPQGKAPDIDAGRMIHAGNRLMSGGRSLGIRGMMITQRPAKLHKDSLTCADTLIAMRVIAPQDRAAIKEWVDGCGDPAQGKQVLDSLAQLARGEGWVWYPEGGILQRTKFPAIETYDSSATPKHGAKAAPVVGAINLDEVRKALADAVAEAEANDPKKLRARIAELERAKPQAVAPAVDVEAIRAAAKAEARAGVRKLVDGIRDTIGRLLGEAGTAANETDALLSLLNTTPFPPGFVPAASNKSYTLAAPAPRPARESARAGGGKSADRLLWAVAFWEALGVEPTRAQAAAVMGYSHTSRGFLNPLYANTDEGNVLADNGTVTLTPDGRAKAPKVGRPESLGELHEMVLGHLNGKAREMMEIVLGGEMTRKDLAARLGYSEASRGFLNPLYVLTGRGMAETSNGKVRPAAFLFPASLR